MHEIAPPPPPPSPPTLFSLSIHPSCSSGCNPLCRALVGHRGTHASMSHTLNMLSLPTHIINTRSKMEMKQPPPPPPPPPSPLFGHVGDLVRRRRARRDPLLSPSLLEGFSPRLSTAPTPTTTTAPLRLLSPDVTLQNKYAAFNLAGRPGATAPELCWAHGGGGGGG